MAAMTALLMFALAAPALQAAPRSKTSAATGAKKKAAAAKAATQRKAEAKAAAAVAAAAAAEAARVRAQWGLLADLAERDFDGKGALVTVRREDGGNTMTLSVWGSLVHQSYRVKRDAATGALTYDFPGSWGREQHPARLGANGAVEGVMKNDVSWPIVKRDEAGDVVFAFAAGRKLPLKPVDATGKAGKRLAGLVAKGKVTAADAAETSARGPSLPAATARAVPSSSGAPTAVGVPSLGAMQASNAVEALKTMNGSWSNGNRLWTFTAAPDHVFLDQSGIDGKKVRDGKIERSKDSLVWGGARLVPISGGYYLSGNEYAILVKSRDEFAVTAGEIRNGAFWPKRSQDKPFLGPYRRLSTAEATAWRARAQANRSARQTSGGNSGWLGGLIMGGVAAAAGGNAEMVMGAAMKGVEMTTDNQMSRNVLSGQGDSMIADGVQRRASQNRPVTGGGSNAQGGSLAAAKPASRGTAGASLAKGSANAYFVVGMRPGDRNTRNPMCYSTVFSISFERDPNGWGDNGRAMAAMKPYEGAFLQKCSRNGQVDGVVNPAIEGVSSGFPRPTPHREDTVVNIP